MEREKSVAARGFQRLKDYMNANIVGQADLVDKLLIALLADGHLLVEGAPGLAKTKAIKKLSEAIEGDDQRIQFTPVRHYGQRHLPSRNGRVQISSGADFSQLDFGGRNQPRACESAVRFVGSHGGTAGDRRRENIPATRFVYGDGDPKSD